ncbi:MAG: hypothetical protein K6E51_09660 [Treponema sp.]|nr:hypothetical protein [Treponema sp.]
MTKRMQAYIQTARSLQEELARPKDQYAMLLPHFVDTPYRHGEESIDVSDCSGSVCAVLNTVYNRQIRVRADDLYKYYFTKPLYKDTDDIAAVFFVDTQDKAVHVAGRICANEYMNVSSVEKAGGRIRTLESLLYMYSDYKPVLRILQDGIWQ